jgi:hypothetical protein
VTASLTHRLVLELQVEHVGREDVNRGSAPDRRSSQRWAVQRG